MSYFCAENIYKKFDGLEINFSFTAKKGSFTCITGPSGSGKTTALRIIAGLEKSPAVITLDGKCISNLESSKRDLGFVFQKSALFMNMNVQKNIEFALRVRGVKKSERINICLQLLKKMGLEGFEKRSCTELSGGEEQRVSLARSLAAKPKLLLLDEPFSALDKERRKNLGELLKSLQKNEGLTFIMVTHDMEEAKALSDRIIKIQDGKKIFDGIAEDFFSKKDMD